MEISNLDSNTEVRLHLKTLEVWVTIGNGDTYLLTYKAVAEDTPTTYRRYRRCSIHLGSRFPIILLCNENQKPFLENLEGSIAGMRKIFGSCVGTLAGSQVSSSLANMSKIMVAIEGEAL